MQKTLFRVDRGPYERKRWSFVVEGRGEFPTDMLRYDGCWPARQEDVPQISLCRFHDTEHLGLRRVHLRGINEPTIARWASFGWRVVPLY